MTHEPYMKFKFRCSYLKFYSNTTTSFIYTSSMAVFRLKCRVVVIEMVHGTFSVPTAAVDTTHCSHSVMIPQVFQCHIHNILLFKKISSSYTSFKNNESWPRQLTSSSFGWTMTLVVQSKSYPTLSWPHALQHARLPMTLGTMILHHVCALSYWRN